MRGSIMKRCAMEVRGRIGIENFHGTEVIKYTSPGSNLQ